MEFTATSAPLCCFFGAPFGGEGEGSECGVSLTYLMQLPLNSPGEVGPMIDLLSVA